MCLALFARYPQALTPCPSPKGRGVVQEPHYRLQIPSAARSESLFRLLIASFFSRAAASSPERRTNVNVQPNSMLCWRKTVPSGRTHSRPRGALSLPKPSPASA